MENPARSKDKSVEKGRPNVLAFAVTVGLLVFFVTGELDGGLTGLEGFFVGTFSVIFIFISIGLLERRQESSSSRGKELHLPGHLLVNQSDSEGGVSIKIQLGRELSSKLEHNQ